jgi:hypothetical protein
MSTYSIDLAFDWDAEPSSEYDGLLELACVDGSDLKDLDKLHVNDQIYFALYDNSDDGSGAKTLGTLTVSFAAADAETKEHHDSPIVDGNGNDVTQIQLASFYARGEKTSTAFGTCPSWFAQAAPGGGSKASNLTLANAGRYYVNVTVPVSLGGTTKTYGEDPKMDIGT